MASNETIMVVLGAGASHDCVSVEPRNSLVRGWRPPLVTELFSPRFEKVLLRYPMVHNAAPEIRQATTLGTPAQIGLEDYLRTAFRDSDDPDDQRTYAAIPLYLQELLVEVGRNWPTARDSYQLLHSLLRRNFREVVYVTLNYDTLLDGILARGHPLSTFDDYIHPDTRWSLIKPHGSVTWRRRISNASGLPGWSFANPPANVEQVDILEHCWSDDLDRLRRSHDERNGGFIEYYPALSVPLGPGVKEINCPPEHLEWLASWLSKQGAINLLTIGYSAMDRGVLDLMAETGCAIKTALAVCGDGATAYQVLGRIGERLGFEVDVMHQVCPGGFAATTMSEDFSAWIARAGRGERIPTFFQSTLEALGVGQHDPDPLYDELSEMPDLHW
jgi:hypothetical protein